tara:strand:+ start:449 stop:625 length:177 start_codon:yes stop_codon:yes gene_type:complete
MRIIVRVILGIVFLGLAAWLYFKADMVWTPAILAIIGAVSLIGIYCPSCGKKRTNQTV